MQLCYKHVPKIYFGDHPSKQRVSGILQSSRLTENKLKWHHSFQSAQWRHCRGFQQPSLTAKQNGSFPSKRRFDSVFSLILPLLTFFAVLLQMLFLIAERFDLMSNSIIIVLVLSAINVLHITLQSKNVAHLKEMPRFRNDIPITEAQAQEGIPAVVQETNSSAQTSEGLLTVKTIEDSSSSTVVFEQVPPELKALNKSTDTGSIPLHLLLLVVTSFLEGLHLRFNQKDPSTGYSAIHNQITSISRILYTLGMRPQVENMVTCKSTNEVVCFISKLQGLGMTPVHSDGKASGQWVTDDALLQLLEFLSSNDCHKGTYRKEKYDVRVCYLDKNGHVLCPALDSESVPTVNVAVLIVHLSSATVGTHFSSFIINPKRKLIHVFDTIWCWEGYRVGHTIKELFPNMKLQEAGFTVRNHSGQVKQSGGTCGPWTLWTIFAYAFNHDRFREKDDRLNLAKLSQNDALCFWRSFTV